MLYYTNNTVTTKPQTKASGNKYCLIVISVHYYNK